MKINPYLGFDGRCEEAFRFYAETLGGEVESTMRWSDMPKGEGGGFSMADDKVLHTTLLVGDMRLMGSDNPPGMYERPAGFSVLLEIEDADRAGRVFDALSQGGEVRMPFADAFWGDRFGLVVDRYGTPWSVITPTPAG